MHTIESLDVLRETLNELIESGYVVASGPVERRGVEIDHALSGHMEPMTPTPEAPATVATPSATNEIAELRREVDALKQQVARLNSELGIE